MSQIRFADDASEQSAKDAIHDAAITSVISSSEDEKSLRNNVYRLLGKELLDYTDGLIAKRKSGQENSQGKPDKFDIKYQVDRVIRKKY
jgi:hypothetical protein